MPSVSSLGQELALRNVHIYPSPFTHESRILKEAQTLSAMLGIADISLVGVKVAGLPTIEQVAPGIVIRRLGPSKGRGLMKAVRHLLWCLNVLWFCLRCRADLVNCHSLPVLPIGVIVKWLTRSKLVYDAHELETETVGSSTRRRQVGRAIERLCIRFVDLLIVVSPGIEAWYRRRYTIRATVTVLNAPRRRQPTPTAQSFSSALGFDASKKVVLYQGGLAAGRGLEALAAAAPALDEAGYALVLMGFGPLHQELVEKSRTGRFYVHPAVSPEVLLDYTAAADIGLCLIEDSCLSYRLSLPNKLFEYAMARLPVVASDLPEIRAVVEGSRIGACITGWNAADIVETIRRADAMRGPELDARLDQVAKDYCWEREEHRMCEAYRAHIWPNLTAH